ncbi:MAG TPA: hypothetical protein VGP57_15070 [Actinoplanes sp.]|jgi:hypothetical protein|nr:hypothetical protein [Actinoplanes sp.]
MSGLDGTTDDMSGLDGTTDHDLPAAEEVSPVTELSRGTGDHP